MKPTLKLITALLAVSCGHLVAANGASLSPLDIPYSADAPPGPSFTDAQKQEQRKAGLQMLASLRAAYASGGDSFTMPPGDYRFGTAWKGKDSFIFENFNRDGKTPFRIVGHGATLWFDLIPDSAPRVNFMIRLSGCSNITLEGLTIQGNVVINPFMANPVLPETEWKELPAFTLDRAKGSTIKNNLVIRRDTGAAIVSEKSCEANLQSGNRTQTHAEQRLLSFIRQMTASHEHDAKTIIKQVRAEAEALVEANGNPTSKP